MRDWDRMLMLIIGGLIALYLGYGGWRSGQQGEWKAAVGSFLLVLLVIASPLMLAIFGP